MRVLIVTNDRNQRAVDAARELAVWLAASEHEPVLSLDDAVAVGLPAYGVSPADVAEPGLVVALGGDGTILKAVHLLGETSAPVLGVNLGRLGFLAATEADGMREAVVSALTGECAVEHRATLSANVEVGGREAGRHHALNEVFVGRTGAGRVVELAVHVNGTELAHWVCDGIVVATPTGSTAYALSAGGPVVSPDARGIVLVPVAPHTLDARPFVLGPNDTVEISCPNPARADACVTVDGEPVPCRQRLEKVTVWTSGHDVLLVKGDDRDFYDVVRAKFLGR